MSTLRGADVVARTLEALGVSRVFTLSGNHIMPVFDALLETRIEIVHVRHEAAAVHMADAWGRLTGEPGVALVTGGGGHANAAAALFTALAAESPLLLLSGHAGLSELGRGGFQEMPQADMARPVAKAAWTATGVATLGPEVARALRLAREGRPGPVHLSLPVDVLDATLPAGLVPVPEAAPRVAAPEPALIERVVAALAQAERPLIACGPALCGPAGRAAMAALERVSGIPVVGMESPRGLNDPSLGDLAAVLAETDLLVLVGKPLDFTLRFGAAVPPACRLAVIDPDPTLIARADPARLAAAGAADPVPTLAALAERLEGASRFGTWAERARGALTYVPPAWARARGEGGRVHPVEVCRAVDAFLGRHPGAAAICDGGEFGQWAQAIVRAERRLINGVSGTIGAAIPFAIAARAQAPDAPVVALMGDGTVGFHMAEFDTGLRHGLPFVAVVGNDACWNAERQIQIRDYGPARARHCDLNPTRYDRVVEALGGFGALVTDAADLPAALEAAHASGVPACVNVMIEGAPAPVIRQPR